MKRRYRKRKGRELSLRQKEVCRWNSDRMDYVRSFIGKATREALKAGTSSGGKGQKLPSSRWLIIAVIEVGLPLSYGKDDRERVKQDIKDRSPISDWRPSVCQVGCDCVCDKPMVMIEAYDMHSRRKPSEKTAERLETWRQSVCDAVAAVLGEDAVSATRRGEEVDVGKLPMSKEPPQCQLDEHESDAFDTPGGFLLGEYADYENHLYSKNKDDRHSNADMEGRVMSTNTYEAHPLADRFPMMSGGELKELADDIRVNKLLEPIVLYQNQVLDGRCRQKACVLAGVEPRYVEYEGDSPVHFVWSKNIPRRHLTPSQRAALVLSLKDDIARESKKRISKGGLIRHQRMEKIPEAERGTTRDKMAKIANVNPRYVQDAMRIEKESPAKLAEVVDGKLSIPDAISSLDGKNRKSVRKPKAAKTSQARERIGGQMPRTGMLARITVAIGSGDTARRQEILDEIVETVRHAAGYDERRWMIEIIEQYREGDIVVHPCYDLPRCPNKWTPLAKETRITDCWVAPIVVTYASPVQPTVQHEVWAKDIWYGLEEMLYPAPETEEDGRELPDFEKYGKPE